MALGDEFYINTTTSLGNHKFPDVTHLKNGNFMVTWTSPEGNIVGQIWAADGSIVGQELTINKTTAHTQTRPTIDSFSDGGFVIAWVSPHTEENERDLNHDIMAQRFNPDGSENGAEFLVNSEIEYDQNEPSVTVLKDDKFLITWSSLNQDFNKYGIYAQKYNADGTTDGDEFRMNTHTYGDQRGSSAVALDDGSYWIVAYSTTIEPKDPKVYEGVGLFAKKYNEDGTENGEEFLVNTHIPQGQGFGRMVQLNNGNIMITWESFNQDQTGNGYQGIYGQIYQPSGERVGAEFLINTYVLNGQRLPAIAAFDDGGFVVTWDSNAQEGTDGLGYSGIYAQKFNNDGTKDGEEFHVNDIANLSQKDQTIAALGDGTFVIVWTSQNNVDVLANGVNGIKAKIFHHGEVDTGGEVANPGYNGGTVGNDVILEPLGNMTISGGDGQDKIVVLSGYNNIDGAAGNDFILGGFEHDVLVGGDGNDILRGDASDLLGSSDKLSGGAGDDLLMGGVGADTFSFKINEGNDIIGHFETANVSFNAITGYSATADAADFQSGIDHIQLIGFTNITAANVMDSISDVDGSAVFNAEGTQITFNDILESQLSADDFLFCIEWTFK